MRPIHRRGYSDNDFLRRLVDRKKAPKRMYYALKTLLKMILKLKYRWRSLQLIFKLRPKNDYYS